MTKESSDITASSAHLVKKLTKQLEQKERQIRVANMQIAVLESRINSIYGTASWRMTTSLRRFGRFLEKLFGKKRVYFSSSFCGSHKVVRGGSLEKISSLTAVTGTIGIHLHLYYTDLLGEIISFLGNMPFEYNLYVSLVDESKVEYIQKELSSLTYARSCKVKIVPNRGRDVAPFVVTFADDLLKCDYVCHIHSKKSLYTGNEQSSWRKHLLNNLLGNAQIVQKIFSIFNTYEDVGILYPSTFEKIPYWAHSWLSNKHLGQQLCMKFHASCDPSGYIDAPVGTMFWARTAALKPLLSADYGFKDFPEECGQADGTLAHAIERILVPVALAQNFTFCEINKTPGTYSVSFGQRNLYQYWKNNLKDLKKAILRHDLIVFDIFDSLITRPLLYPDSVFDLLSIDVERTEGISNFKQLRKSAEYRLRSNLKPGTDVAIDDIYVQIGSSLKLNKSCIERLMAMERCLELSLSIPRAEVVEAFNFAVANGKHVVLMSDMYLDDITVRQLLNKNGVRGYEDLFLSSVVGARKDDASMWHMLFERYQDLSILHVGDNEHSDVQIPFDTGISVYHVMSSKNIFKNVLLGRELTPSAIAQNVSSSAIIGISINNIFNNPFSMHECGTKYLFTDKYRFGYSIIGPVVFAYLSWLLKSILKENISKLLFFAREGYLLKHIFDIILCDQKEFFSLDSRIETIYLLASRRALTVPAIVSIEDALGLLQKHYKGKLYNLVESRYGLDQKYLGERGVTNSYVELPKDRQKVAAIIVEYFGEISGIAAKERNAYLKYLERIGVNSSGRRLGVSDLGYSGSIQKGLSHLMETSLTGYYFATNFDVEENDIHNNSFTGFFADYDTVSITESPVFRYSLVLESILTAPEGQLKYFEDTGDGVIPVFGSPADNYNDIREIQKGITSYCTDMTKYFGRYFLDFEPDSKIAEYLFGKVISENMVADQLLSHLKIEDKYCSDGDIRAL